MKASLHGLGFLLWVPGLMALSAVPVCLWFGDQAALLAYLVTAAVSAAAGATLVLPTRGATKLSRSHAMLIAALAWLIVPLIGALPLWIGGQLNGELAFHSFPNAWFEAASGFTGTGLSVASHPSLLPPHAQWWRSLTEWVGGIGVIVLALSVLPVNRSALHLYFSEGREEKTLPTVKSTVRSIWSIYLIFTVIGIGALMLAGEPAWRAVNHGMTAISTGGFSITDDSLAYTSRMQQWVYCVLMVAGAISFTAHYRIFRQGRIRETLWQGAEPKLFLGLLFGGMALVSFESWWFQHDQAWTGHVLHWISALTTTGFDTGDLTAGHPLILLLLIAAMVVGPMAGSTGSGIKQIRLALILKSLLWALRDIQRGKHEIIRLGFGSERLTQDEANTRLRAAATMVAAYLVLWGLGAVALAHVLPAGTSLQHVFFETASAQSNVGLSTGITDAGMPLAGKLILILLMVVGRLEIFPFLVLGAWLLGRPR